MLGPMTIIAMNPFFIDFIPPWTKATRKPVSIEAIPKKIDVQYAREGIESPVISARVKKEDDIEPNATAQLCPIAIHATVFMGFRPSPINIGANITIGNPKPETPWISPDKKIPPSDSAILAPLDHFEN